VLFRRDFYIFRNLYKSLIIGVEGIWMNEVQKNFNKQMESELKRIKKKDKDDYHEYIKWNHLDDSKSRLTEEAEKGVSNMFMD